MDLYLFAAMLPSMIAYSRVFRAYDPQTRRLEYVFEEDLWSSVSSRPDLILFVVYAPIG
jgi:hypothetical protein